MQTHICNTVQLCYTFQGVFAFLTFSYMFMNPSL